MGTVHLALDTKLNRLVAIKLLSGYLADAVACRRFQREAQLASSLNHPHIVTVHDVGEFKGRQFLVMEYVDAGTLKDWRLHEQHEWRDVLEMLVGVADGLAAAHDAGILHRDIKPTNILITRSGYAKLADFGLAKLAAQPAYEDGTTRTMSVELTRPGTLVGTIAYMSPERASGRAIDARTDIFSFAVMLYEMLAGRRPFEGATDLEILQKIIGGSPLPLGLEIPSSVRAMVEKALVKDPAQRYQSMRLMVAEMRRLMRLSTDGVGDAVKRFLFFVGKHQQDEPAEALWPLYGVSDRASAFFQRIQLGVTLTPELDSLRTELGHDVFNSTMRYLQEQRLVEPKGFQTRTGLSLFLKLTETGQREFDKITEAR